MEGIAGKPDILTGTGEVGNWVKVLRRHDFSALRGARSRRSNGEWRDWGDSVLTWLGGSLRRGLDERRLGYKAGVE